MTHAFENPSVATAIIWIEYAIQNGPTLPDCPLCCTPTDGVTVERQLDVPSRYTLKPCGHVLQNELRLERP